ncbi:hypothetical protein ISS42_01185 [Candidatus Shapirobacteria bacterium]|nr:hypothetical protein [Candidatus Shapirobacteria bacterium]
MKNFLNRYWFLIFLAFGATFLVLAKKFFQANPFPVVVSLNPPSGELKSLPETIEINFQELSGFLASDFFLSSVPNLQFDLEIKENTLLAKPKSKLVSGESYILELRHQNQPLYSWSYRLIEVAESVLEGGPGYGRGDPDAFEKIERETLNDYPLIKLMPQETENYYLNYTEPLVLGIRVKKGGKEEVKREVELWLEETGVGAESHELIWFE